jgi:hypothetical protein
LPVADAREFQQSTLQSDVVDALLHKPTKARQVLAPNDRHKPVQVWLAQLRGADRRQKVHEPTSVVIGGVDEGAQMDPAVTIFDDANLPALHGRS